MIEANIISIDNEMLNELKQNNAFVYAIHHHSLHLKVGEKIMTLGCQITSGRHHIVIDSNLRFKNIGLKTNEKVIVDQQTIKIGSYIFHINDLDIHLFRPYKKTYKVNDDVRTLLKRLEKMIDKEQKHHLFIHGNHPVETYVLEKIEAFLNNQSFENAIKLVGLGQGLTPLGDDIIVGYILGINTLGLTIPWVENIIEIAKVKTNLFSKQNLEDAHLKLYPTIYIQLIEDLFINKKIDHAEDFINIGDTSGVGILKGFLYGIRAGEKNERL
ncbi:MAG: DUF2877 domain-containing protein [Tenericutes bacterium]|nr:DUF2877 domain-containing protein [Mycoplasmatota bacterium]